MPVENVDVLIIGAGISGISAAYHLKKQCPELNYRIVERRQQMGGTWDLFNYPGIRSDSDMHTFGFSFRDWEDDSSIAVKSKILDYLKTTSQEYGIDQQICYGQKVNKAEWNSKEASWQLEIEEEETGTSSSITARFIYLCVGYYNYDEAYQPKFKHQDRFEGELIHPQFWPENFDYTDKKIVIIGSGATAVTLIPSLTEKAEKVTMLQRSPTYMGAKPAKNAIANRLASVFGRGAARWWFILTGLFFYSYCRAFPKRAKKAIIKGIKDELGDKFEAKHFTPNYNPWDQRVCLCPDGDFFKSLKSGKADIATDVIDHFTSKGIKLVSGQELEADTIVTATGLKMLFAGGIQFTVDGERVDPSNSYVYKGTMINNVPNLFIAVGYTNASWTLKVDMSNHYGCRVINYLKSNNYAYCFPEIDENAETVPLLDLTAGYVQRSTNEFPKQSNKYPWRLYQNYLYDRFAFKYFPVKDKAMQFR